MDASLQRDLELRHRHAIQKRLNSFLIKLAESKGFSLLHTILASERESLVADVKRFLYCGADPNFKCSCGCNVTPLCIALNRRDRIGIITALVEGGARVEQPNGDTMSRALSLNVEFEVVKLLLRAGADLFTPDLSGASPIFHALKYLSPGTSKKPWSATNVSAFRSLLNLQDVDINTARNQFNGSLLHGALQMKECTEGFVKLLIDRDIRVDSVDRFGDMPLHVALRNPTSCPGIIDLLLRRGSSVNTENNKRITPLRTVMEYWSLSVKELVLKYSLLENQDFHFEDWILIPVFKKELSKHASGCKSELKKMKSENVGGGRTLFEFLQTFSGNNKMNRTGKEGFDVDQLLQIISGKLYPLYEDVISSKLQRSLLKETLGECDVFTVVEDKSDIKCVTRKILLKRDCTRILADYLDENDLLSMIMVFRK